MVLLGPGWESWLRATCRYSSLTLAQLPLREWRLSREVASFAANVQAMLAALLCLEDTGGSFG